MVYFLPWWVLLACLAASAFAVYLLLGRTQAGDSPWTLFPLTAVLVPVVLVGAAVVAITLSTLLILAIGWTLTGLLTLIIIGFLLIPVMIVLSAVPFVHMAYAAYKVNQGVDYRYPFVADLVGGGRRSGTL